jgi:hypothetical protein
LDTAQQLDRVIEELGKLATEKRLANLIEVAKLTTNGGLNPKQFPSLEQEVIDNYRALRDVLVSVDRADLIAGVTKSLLSQTPDMSAEDIQMHLTEHLRKAGL